MPVPAADTADRMEVEETLPESPATVRLGGETEAGFMLVAAAAAEVVVKDKGSALPADDGGLVVLARDEVGDRLCSM